MIAIVDYEMGNIHSLENALKRLGAEFRLTADPVALRGASHVILPGVGNCGEAFEKLQERGLCEVIRHLRRPVLGICVGMQVMCRDSEENAPRCLDIFDSHVRRFQSAPGVKVPHVGWNSLTNMEGRLLAELPANPYVYYVHSYRADLSPDTVATTEYAGEMFSAVLKYENFYGTQFHPEKSGDFGTRLLRNFLKL